MKNFFLKIYLSALFLFLSVCFFNHSYAGGGEIDSSERLFLARSFVEKMKAGLNKADAVLISIGTQGVANIVPEGEILLLQPVLSGHLVVDGVITAQMRNSKFLFSLKDFVDLLQFPIEVDASVGRAKGWYIRQHKPFELDIAQNYTKTDHGEFLLSQHVLVEDNDIWVPAHELGQWLDFDFDIVVPVQEMRITSSERLPIEERFLRRKWRDKQKSIGEPVLPRKDQEHKSIDIPMIDVATNSRYDRKGDSAKSTMNHNVTVRTVGDFAQGTLITHTQANNRDQINSVRVNYKKESRDAELLGPLKARRYEVGDVSTARLPLGATMAQETGVRVTNTDSLRTFSRPTTAISGYAFPEWDVELFRDNQLLAFQEVDEEGYYLFDDVRLMGSDNNFRLVFYGPQGEVREEHVSVPVDFSRLSQGKGIYDVSLTLDSKQAFLKHNGIRPVDEGAPNLQALYEYPVADGTALSIGMRSSEHEGERNTVAHTGLSTTLAQTLINSNVAVDDDGEMAAELVARRTFGEHDISNSIKWTGENFDTQSQGDTNDIGTLRNDFYAIGPIPEPVGVGRRPYYNLSMGYSTDTDGDYNLVSALGVSTSYKRFSFNEQMTYITGSAIPDDSLSSVTNVTGTFGRNRIRASLDYKMKPDSELNRVLASYRRNFSNKLDLTLEAERRYAQSLNQYSARLDWQAGFVRLSPRVTYNSENDFFAGLTTRFGLLKDPQSGKFKMYDRTISSNGGVSAFVFVDSDGDGQWSEGEEKIEGAVLEALQNGGRKETDENGIAIFNNMFNLKLTDIYIDPSSLGDPSWIPGFEGVSILPRSGYIAQVDFPVHIAGELDGMLYANVAPLEGDDAFVKRAPVPLRKIKLKLYNDKGEVEQVAITDSGGFYYFTLVPPGRYLLIIDEKSAHVGHFIRPEPQPIEIGYDGTVIYGNDIYVDTGLEDVPSDIRANLEDYKARHPHVEFTPDEHDLVLNLGEYNSRLLMSVVWYKIRSRFGEILEDGELFVPPAESYADVKTGKHVLRVGLGKIGLEEAYRRCRSLMVREQYCKVEVYPAHMKAREMKQAALDQNSSVE